MFLISPPEMTGEASSSSSSLSPPPPLTLLALGFRFHPTDEELVSYCLKRKVYGRPIFANAIAEVDLYKFELPAMSRFRSRDTEWYFFTPLDRKRSARSRVRRTTSKGYWKITGRDRPVRHDSRVIGMNKTLVFHLGRTPRGEQTDWVMHEYRLEDEDLAQFEILQDAFVLSKIFHKRGPGPQNSAQYGAPFVEEECDGQKEQCLIQVLMNEDGSGDDALMDEAVHDYLHLDDFLEDLVSSIQNEDDPPLVMSLSAQVNDDNSPDPSTSLCEELVDEGFLDGFVLEDFLVDNWFLSAAPLSTNGSVEQQSGIIHSILCNSESYEDDDTIFLGSVH